MGAESWLEAIAKIDGIDARGTAFVISEQYALTAYHVLNDALKGHTPPHSVKVELRFLDNTVEFCQAIHWDTEADWLLLERMEPSNRPVLRLMELAQGQPAWRSKGFPATKPDGMRVRGTVSSWKETWGGVEVIQLLCTEALAGNLETCGLSGAPCIVGAGGAIGLLRKNSFEKFTENNAGGSIYACSSQVVLDGLRTRGITVPPPWTPARLPRLCRLQRERTLRDFEPGGPFQPHLHTPRQPVESFLAELANGAALPGKSICAVIGGSGIGKTDLFANVAQQASDQSSVLFIRARNCLPGSQSLADAVERELTLSAEEEGAPVGFSVAEVLKDSQAHRLILLDGLNELPRAIDAETWVERSILWLKASCSTTLVVSCRPEYWERFRDCIPEQLCFAMPSPASEQRWSGPVEDDKFIVLGDFNPDEADDALSRAFGSRPPINAQDATHPLLLRFYRELYLGQETAVRAPSKLQVLDKFLKFKLRAAAKKHEPIIERSIEDKLRELASRRALGDREGDYPLPAPLLLPALINTGLVDLRGNDLAFVHDEMLEYLASGAIRLADFDQVGLAELKAKPELHRVGALKFALMMALQTNATDTQARDVVQALLIPAYWALDVVADVLVSLPDASHFFKEVSLYLNQSTNGFVTQDHRKVLPKVRLDTRRKLRLLRECREDINAYDFECHHWKDIEIHVLRSGPLDWVRDVIEADPISSFEELESWLDDHRHLSDNKASVSKLAGGLLCCFANLDFERAVLAMVRGRFARVTYFFDAHPETTENLALRWLDGPARENLSMALPLCHWLAERQRITPKLVDASHRAIDRLPAGSHDYRSLRQVLLKAEPAGRRFNAELLAEMGNTHPDDRGEEVSLPHLLHTDFNSTLTMLWRLKWISDSRMVDLGNFVGTVKQHVSLVSLLRRILHRHVAHDDYIAHAVELQLRCASPASIECSGLIRLARAFLLGQDASLAEYVFHAVLARLQDAQVSWPRLLLYEVIDRTPNGRTAGMLLHSIAALTPFWSAIGPRLSTLRHAMGAEKFECYLLRAASTDHSVADQLIWWANEQPKLFKSGKLQRFKSLVSTGKSPADAAYQCWRE